ncbi:MAG: lysine 2,3-aminomutase, partial [Actinomycetota bacterium]|nr:lysine 2,3-aminomutase [Actinomycetota bacterium]
EQVTAERSERGWAPLLEAIADGTFGHMKRPADQGKGLDGVAAKAPDYDNPATSLLEQGQAPDPAGGAR